MSYNSIYRKDGKLSYYGLACGYVQVFKNNKGKVELYMEHNHYHVRKYVGVLSLDWETFDCGELSKARKCFNTLKKSILLSAPERN